MEVEGYCRECGHVFDAHWDIWKDGKCPKCGSLKVRTTNDESNNPPADYESPRGDDDEEVETCD